jgi:hypothetical protein
MKEKKQVITTEIGFFDELWLKGTRTVSWCIKLKTTRACFDRFGAFTI